MIGRLSIGEGTDEGLAEAADWIEFGDNHSQTWKQHASSMRASEIASGRWVEVYYAQEPQPQRLGPIFVFDPVVVTNTRVMPDFSVSTR